MHRWQHPPILAGQDRESGGTWLALQPETGRFAAVTNLRNPDISMAQAAEKKSRGELVVQTIMADDPHNWCKNLQEEGHQYRSHNLIYIDESQSMSCISSDNYWHRHDPDIDTHEALVLSVSNCSQKEQPTAWPKCDFLTRQTQSVLNSYSSDTGEQTLDLTDALLQVIQTKASTGGLEQIEKSPFIYSDSYGTRCTTVVLWHSPEQYRVVEVNYLPNNGGIANTIVYSKLANSLETVETLC